jgi:putative RNA 2'-phosphotransferase
MKNLSRFLSLVLRHEPSKAGIVLDAGGWVSVSDLLKGLKSVGKSISLDELKEIVENNNKKRFSFSEDGKKIRAVQGHSIDVDLGYKETEPPEELYHGTATRNVKSIFEKGIIKGDRHHVHLSKDKSVAWEVGKRHGKPMLLSVDAGKMYKAGKKFYCSDNGVWLVEEVEPKYIALIPYVEE